MNGRKKTKSSAPGCGPQCVYLELIRPEAQVVCVAGSFNDWHPSATPMVRLNSGKWTKELSLTPGRYECRFIVDGQWVDDPAAKEFVPNPFGGANAVLVVVASEPPSS